MLYPYLCCFTLSQTGEGAGLRKLVCGLCSVQSKGMGSISIPSNPSHPWDNCSWSDSTCHAPPCPSVAEVGMLLVGRNPLSLAGFLPPCSLCSVLAIVEFWGSSWDLVSSSISRSYPLCLTNIGYEVWSAVANKSQHTMILVTMEMSTEVLVLQLA